MVNFIKSQLLNARVFRLLCESMGSTHETLLLHTEVRWLSRGKVLPRFFELRKEIMFFLSEHPFQLSAKPKDQCWMERLAYLSDIFGYLNEVNLAMQGTNVTCFKVKDKMNAF